MSNEKGCKCDTAEKGSQEDGRVIGKYFRSWNLVLPKNVDPCNGKVEAKFVAVSDSFTCVDEKPTTPVVAPAKKDFNWLWVLAAFIVVVALLIWAPWSKSTAAPVVAAQPALTTAATLAATASTPTVVVAAAPAASSPLAVPGTGGVQIPAYAKVTMLSPSGICGQTNCATAFLLVPKGKGWITVTGSI